MTVRAQTTDPDDVRAEVGRIFQSLYPQQHGASSTAAMSARYAAIRRTLWVEASPRQPGKE